MNYSLFIIITTIIIILIIYYYKSTSEYFPMSYAQNVYGSLGYGSFINDDSSEHDMLGINDTSS